MKKIQTVEALRAKRMELLKEEISLVQTEEMLQKCGEHEEALCVKAERNEVYLERMAIERRLNFFQVGFTA